MAISNEAKARIEANYKSAIDKINAIDNPAQRFAARSALDKEYSASMASYGNSSGADARYSSADTAASVLNEDIDSGKYGEQWDKDTNSIKGSAEQAEAQSAAESANIAADAQTDNPVAGEQSASAAASEGTSTDAANTSEAGTDKKKSPYLTERRPKYTNVKELHSTQEPPQSKKIINFKQDYVVIIRKKPYFASTYAKRKDAPEGSTAEDNFLRVYQVNNFLSLNTKASVYGKSPGTASVQIRGGERVPCAENSDVNGEGWLNWSDLLGGWLQINERATQGVTAERYKKFGNAGDVQSTASTLWNTVEPSFRGLGAKQNEATTFRSLLKTREAKYGWRVAEKCDWEPMDELWIFGKSPTARKSEVDSNGHAIPKEPLSSQPITANMQNVILQQLNMQKQDKSEFCFKQIFFGYIENVTKTFNATGGCLITITAKDHLKLLELSRTVMQMALFDGIYTAQGLDVNYGTDEYGQINLFNKDAAQTSEEAKKKVGQTAVLENNLAGCYPDVIVQMLCSRAGIPKKYTTSRVEPVRLFPWLVKTKQASAITEGPVTAKTRLTLLNEMASKLFLEFFADEEGNIVLKLPNYCLGVNLLTPNNANIKYQDEPRLLNMPKIAMEKDEETGQIYGVINVSSEVPDTENKEAVEKDYNSAEVKQGDIAESKGTTVPKTKEAVDPTQEKDNPDYAVEGETEDDGSDEDAASSTVEIDFDNEAVTIINEKSIKITLGKGNINSIFDVANFCFNNPHKWKEIAKTNNINEPTSLLPGDVISVYFDEPILGEAAAGMPIYTNAGGFGGFDSNNRVGSANYKNISGGVNTDWKSSENKQYTFNNDDYKIDANTVKPNAQTSSPVAGEPDETTQEPTQAQKEQKYQQMLNYSYTDADIPVIPAAHIISFTLMDSDKEIYNCFEINGEKILGQRDGVTNKGVPIKRAVPDWDNIMQFGFRPAPGAVNTPLVQDEKAAELFGMIMIMSSYASRYTGSLTCIEDSNIRVGNPVRIHMYDEHPFNNTKFYMKVDNGEKQEMGSKFDTKAFPEQAVFYVTAIDRSISASGVSTMTLQLKAGRMMGQVSIYDYMGIFYDLFYTKDQKRSVYQDGNDVLQKNPYQEGNLQYGYVPVQNEAQQRE